MERIVGFHPVLEALRARRRRLGRLIHRAGLRHPGLPLLCELAAKAGVSVEAVTQEALRQGLAPGVRDQGLVLEADPLPELSLASLLEAAGVTRGARRLVILDGVEDPQNLGAVARVAEASGASGLVLAQRRAAPLSAAACRASAGALEHLPVARVPNLPRALRSLREAGFWLIGADGDGEQGLFDLPGQAWSGELGLVFGAEDRGIRRGVAQLLDHRVRIPMLGRIASLNVATAAAVVLYEAVRQSAPHQAAPKGTGATKPVTRPASARN